MVDLRKCGEAGGGDLLEESPVEERPVEEIKRDVGEDRGEAGAGTRDGRTPRLRSSKYFVHRA